MSAPQVGDVITTAEERDSAPVGIVVWSAEGTLAARYNDQYGVVLGDERTVPWRVLALPLTVLYLPGQLPRPERVVKAEALREAAAQAWEVDGAEDPTRTAFLWLRARANHIERGESL